LWYTSVILAFRRLRQKDCEFRAILCYIMRPCLKKERERERERERQSTVAQACNPSYSRGENQGQPGQKVHETPSQPMAGTVVYIHHPNYSGKH
jgi:hypothetical protein